MAALDTLVLSPLWEAFALGVGLIVGSFANVLIHRLPRGESVVAPRSRCPACHALIASWDNVPVLSWLLLRGRCRRCRAPISPRYPAVEAANGVLYLALALREGPTLAAMAGMAFATALLVLGLIDLEHQVLPDAVTFPGIGLGIGASVLRAPIGPLDSATAALGGYLALAAVATLARWHYGEEALGQGDWKLAAMLGAFLGWRGMMLAVLLGTLAGSIVGIALVVAFGASGRTKLPLGTFLAAGGLAALFLGADLIGWYAGVLRG